MTHTLCDLQVPTFSHPRASVFSDYIFQLLFIPEPSGFLSLPWEGPTAGAELFRSVMEDGADRRSKIMISQIVVETTRHKQMLILTRAFLVSPFSLPSDF